MHLRQCRGLNELVRRAGVYNANLKSHYLAVSLIQPLPVLDYPHLEFIQHLFYAF
jgi:hypothetical protein